MTTTNTGFDASGAPLRRLAGAALIAAPVLMTGGMLTSPPQAGDSSSAYLSSLAEDFGLTVLSANLFHYAWVLIALGVPGALLLLRGRRGRGLTTAGVVLTMFGAVQMSGLLLSDWFTGTMPDVVPLGDAVRVFDQVTADPSLNAWRLSGMAGGVLLLPLVLAGLARAGVVGWWTVPVVALPYVAGPAVPVAGPVLALAAYAPLMLIGVRLLRRSRSDVRTAEAAGPYDSADRPAEIGR
ncbi:hypothetical protein ACWEQG_32785 [Microbispora sp. NPDC004025]